MKKLLLLSLMVLCVESVGAQDILPIDEVSTWLRDNVGEFPSEIVFGSLPYIDVPVGGEFDPLKYKQCLAIALLQRNRSMFKNLLHYGAKIDTEVVDTDKNSSDFGLKAYLIEHAAGNGKLDDVEFLVESGALKTGKAMPLHMAAAGGQVDVVNYFLNREEFREMVNTLGACRMTPYERALLGSQSGDDAELKRRCTEVADLLRPKTAHNLVTAANQRQEYQPAVLPAAERPAAGIHTIETAPNSVAEVNRLQRSQPAVLPVTPVAPVSPVPPVTAAGVPVSNTIPWYERKQAANIAHAAATSAYGLTSAARVFGKNKKLSPLLSLMASAVEKLGSKNAHARLQAWLAKSFGWRLASYIADFLVADAVVAFGAGKINPNAWPSLARMGYDVLRERVKSH